MGTPLAHRIVLSLLLLLVSPALRAAPPPLKVSDDKHFLVTDEGKPFFYLADTAWELFHRLDREQADRYLKNRADKGFTAIQAVVLAELDGLHAPNAYGHTPLKNDDPTAPSEDYFRHVDYVVDKANELGLYIAMLPTWADKVGPRGHASAGPEIFTVANARVYGQFLGQRYKQKAIIWVLGGDRSADDPQKQKIWASMAEGLKAGDGGIHLITFHPPGGQASSKWFHDAPWLDFNMWQNGHCDLVPVWDRIGSDYRREPTKPVIDGEPLYEDHPICFNARERGTSNAADVRRFAYWDVFSGAAGHTYGNHAVWQMWGEGRKPINGPLMPWHEAIDRPGAGQMRHVRALVESRPYLLRTPDQSILAMEPKSGVNAGLKKVVACAASDRSYGLVYIPASRTITVDLKQISGGKAKAWWYDPRSGKADPIGEFETGGKQDFTPPGDGEMQDWVLVLDDASKAFGPPGQR
jgi:hypothetical protein